MNGLLVDADGRGVLAAARKLTGADPLGLLRLPAGGPMALRFADGGEVTARLPGGGVLCGLLLAADRFDCDAELLVLAGPAARWPEHLLRLKRTRPLGADAFFSFEPAEAAAAPRRAGVPLLDLSAACVPALVWARRTGDVFELAQSAVLKGARVNGAFTFGSLVRELLLTPAVAAHQCDDQAPPRAYGSAGGRFAAAA